MNRKKIIIISLILVSFILLVGSAIFYVNVSKEQRRLDPLELESMTKEQIIQKIYERHATAMTPYYYLIPIFAFFGTTVGALIYYILNNDIEKKERLIRYDTDVILKLLNPEERKAVKKIVENGGKIQQVEITYMEGYTKVKAHRVIENLVKKGIVMKENMGKMRLIKMNEEFYNVLKEK